MKGDFNQNESNNKDEVKLPWKTELEVKDLIKPIIIRRLKIFQTLGILLLAFGSSFFYLVAIRETSFGRTDSY